MDEREETVRRLGELERRVGLLQVFLRRAWISAYFLVTWIVVPLLIAPLVASSGWYAIFPVWWLVSFLAWIVIEHYLDEWLKRGRSR